MIFDKYILKIKVPSHFTKKSIWKIKLSLHFTKSYEKMLNCQAFLPRWLHRSAVYSYPTKCVWEVATAETTPYIRVSFANAHICIAHICWECSTTKLKMLRMLNCQVFLPRWLHRSAVYSYPTKSVARYRYHETNTIGDMRLGGSNVWDNTLYSSFICPHFQRPQLQCPQFQRSQLHLPHFQLPQFQLPQFQRSTSF